MISKPNRLLPRAGLMGMVVLSVLTGCTTSKLDLPDSERFPAPQPIVVDGKAAAPGGPASPPTLPSVSGKYPDFSQPLQAASVQMSDEDALKLQEKLSALGRARRSGSISEAQYKARVDELRKLAAEHGTDTVNEIQN